MVEGRPAPSLAIHLKLLKGHYLNAEPSASRGERCHRCRISVNSRVVSLLTLLWLARR